jgi:hypothetical protein
VEVVVLVLQDHLLPQALAVLVRTSLGFQDLMELLALLLVHGLLVVEEVDKLEWEVLVVELMLLHQQSQILEVEAAVEEALEVLLQLLGPAVPESL